jgi:acetylornithine/succinyldiaminopimelate/putrescine aminotransferase
MISRVVSAERGAGDHSGDGKARRVGETALARLREIAERCPLVRSVRGIGLLHAIEVCGDTVAGRTDGQLAEPIAFRLLECGVGVVLFAGRRDQHVCPSSFPSRTGPRKRESRR